MHNSAVRLNIKAIALTLGVIMGPVLHLETWRIILFGERASQPTTTSLIYRGYEISPVGSLYGLFWGFLDGCILGGIFAWACNRLLDAHWLSGNRAEYSWAPL